ncbi:hypothetical protein Pse7367_2192 [Thalassoporum mexicanum PCC 7367]|nr:hypothetical protein Pse7367_2192 [Pseudanabaena sp. PCC 7367]
MANKAVAIVATSLKSKQIDLRAMFFDYFDIFLIQPSFPCFYLVYTLLFTVSWHLVKNQEL